MLLAPYFAREGLQGARVLLLGPDSASGYVTRAGGHDWTNHRVDDWANDDQIEVLVIADQRAVRWPKDLNRALNLIIRRQNAGRSLHLLLCNPDLIFPSAPGRYSLTAGAMAVMLESVFAIQYPERPLALQRLGKPSRPIFDEAPRPTWRLPGFGEFSSI
ncbi:hypothetical protein CKO36_15800 [Rhabdochromatium marinum]|nr:hypothetical protein [Rhabdochromatium marinum]MBK1650019.1 hypothetical protein [Rhabdochromatium marinum]